MPLCSLFGHDKSHEYSTIMSDSEISMLGKLNYYVRKFIRGHLLETAGVKMDHRYVAGWVLFSLVNCGKH